MITPKRDVARILIDENSFVMSTRLLGSSTRVVPVAVALKAIQQAYNDGNKYANRTKKRKQKKQV